MGICGCRFSILSLFFQFAHSVLLVFLTRLRLWRHVAYVEDYAFAVHCARFLGTQSLWPTCVCGGPLAVAFMEDCVCCALCGVPLVFVVAVCLVHERRRSRSLKISVSELFLDHGSSSHSCSWVPFCPHSTWILCSRFVPVHWRSLLPLVCCMIALQYSIEIDSCLSGFVPVRWGSLLSLDIQFCPWPTCSCQVTPSNAVGELPLFTVTLRFYLCPILLFTLW